ncbi:MAG TPA: CDP-glycerol glycerophosphotransferase family protein [bacterium]|nr:CDP-glycerol glycerophosphotransferase family protein [bacterium]
MPAGVTFIDRRTCLTPERHAEILVWAAWLTAGWYRAVGAEQVAAALLVDGIDVCAALEAEKLRVAEMLLERVELLYEVRRRHPQAVWYADGSATDLTMCPELAVQPLLPLCMQRVLRRLEIGYRTRAIRREFMQEPATHHRPKPGSRAIVMPVHCPNRQSLRNQLPYLRLLATEAQYELLLIAPLPELIPIIRDELGGKARCMSWNDYWNAAAERRVRERWRRFNAVMASPPMRTLREKGCRYREVDLTPAMKAEDRFLHGPLAYESLRYAALFEEVFRRERPAVLVVSLDYGWRERTIVDVARCAGVSTVCQHNPQVTPYPEVASLQTLSPPAPDRVPQLRLRVVSDRVTLNGQSMFERLVAGGCVPEALRVTGIPRYDGFRERRAALQRNAMRQRLHIPQQAKIILLATQPPSRIDGSTRADRNRVARAVAGAVAGLADAYLLIKPHPEEMAHAYEGIIASSGVSGSVVDGLMTLPEILVDTALLVTYFSTAALEAIAMEVPVLTINVGGRPDVIPYVAAGAAVGVYHLSELAEKLQLALQPDPMRQQRAHRFLAGMIDLREGAARRCADVVLELAGTGVAAANRDALPNIF